MLSKKLRSYNLQPKKGQALMEVILAMAVFAAIAGVLITMAVGGFRGLEQGGEQSEAEALAQLGIEAVGAVRDRAWNEITCTTCIASQGITKWDLIDGPSEPLLGTNGKFSRTITFYNVCRDNSTDAIATCGTCGATCYADPHSKEAAVSVSWITRTGQSNTVVQRAYISNWDSKDQVEDAAADFSDGTHSSTAASGLGDGASITLLPQ